MTECPDSLVVYAVTTPFSTALSAVGKSYMEKHFVWHKLLFWKWVFFCVRLMYACEVPPDTIVIEKERAKARLSFKKVSKWVN